LYALGTVQGFMDDTQFFLLRTAALFGILLVISSVLGFFIDLGFFLTRKRIHYLGTMVFYFFIGMLGGIIASGSYFIMVVSAGNVN
jgi:hypothetical protein